ncbi:hypothetical protein TrST_g7688 [Triparma strigata]|uniref:Protein-lysine N-methyltransferase TrST_g7688 n=1 Tax=Triparma strigata TaxID=1606541 RepID=A0A9W6ZUV9_9STRA|nr:hypothetical protein TrST_g7688 [Triparma strigata]
MSSEVPPSNLGTQDHWDAVYQRELTNFESNRDDPGDIWYGEQAQSDMVQFGTDLLMDSGKDVEQVVALDLGTGNGCLTLALLEEGYKNVTASDYVQSSVDLARSVCSNGGFEASEALRFFLDDINWTDFGQDFDVVFDKGTMDAYLLNPDHTRQMYVNRVKGMMKVGGILVLASCNNTVEEIEAFFGEVEGWKFLEEKKGGNVFSFGGQSGSTHVILAFEKVC